MEKEHNVIKQKILETLEELEIPVSKIILFGSRAKGNFGENSDWDLLIVLEETLSRDEKREVAHRIRKNLAELYIPSDVIIKSEKEVDTLKNSINSIVGTAIEEGIQL